MRRIASFIVRFHTAIFAAFIVIAVVCCFLAMHVTVNTDMTKYLPAEMQMKQGSDIMSQEFGDATIVELMVRGPQSNEEREKLADDLEKFPHIDSVTYEADNERYNNGEYARYRLTCNDDSYSDYVAHACNEAKGACESRGYEYWIDCESLNSAVRDLTVVLVAAVIIAMLILFILAASWIEPLLLLFTICIAVLINLGTNIVFDSVSDTTNACGSILQMALSMDYLIMLLNRYRKEHSTGVDPKIAMERAITQGVSAIASSSITTVAGLLCLVLMSFTIGRDMGLVLAKGVFLSLICAFAIMPALILWFDGLMERTRKPTPNPKMRLLSHASFKLRYVMVLVFVVLLAVGLAFKGLASPAFITPSKNPDHPAIQEQFNLEEQVVVLYQSKDEEKSETLSKYIEGIDGVLDTSSYATTIAKQKTAGKLASDMDMDDSLVKMLYYYNFKDGKTGSIGRDELTAYVRNQMTKDMGDMLDKDTVDKLDSFADLIEGNLDAGSYTAEQAAAALEDHPSIHPEMLSLIYLAHDANTAFDKSWTMSTEELLTLLDTKVLKDPMFDSAIEDSARKSIDEAYDKLMDGKDNLVNDDYGRIIANVSYAADSNEMSELCTQLREKLDADLDGEYWLVGKGPMVQEMEESFGSEFNFISWVTVGVIFLIVLLTFRNFIIPAILVTLIQTAFNWDLILSGLMGEPVYYVALIVVQSILMGATIDYAILYTTNYREARATHSIRDSVGEAYRNSIRTVCMSGSILVFVCLILGVTAGGITGQICLVISEGATAAVVLVVLVLPGVLAAFDRLVVSKKSRFAEPHDAQPAQEA